MKLKSTIAVLVMAGIPGLALAQTTSTPRIDKRQDIQQHRIDKGAQSSQLTEKEAQKLQRGQQKVQKIEDKAMADGTVTAKEARRVEHAQDQQSKKIYREKNDNQYEGRREQRRETRHEKRHEKK